MGDMKYSAWGLQKFLLHVSLLSDLTNLMTRCTPFWCIYNIELSAWNKLTEKTYCFFTINRAFRRALFFYYRCSCSCFAFIQNTQATHIAYRQYKKTFSLIDVDPMMSYANGNVTKAEIAQAFYSNRFQCQSTWFFIFQSKKIVVYLHRKKDTWQRKDLYINGNFFSLFFQIRNHCMKFVCQLVMIGKMDMIYSLANNSTWQETGWWYSGVRSHLQLSYCNFNQLSLVPNLLVYFVFFQSCFWN